MSFGKVVYCLFIISIALVSGMPQEQTTKPQEKNDGLLPFLQFTNGGIRVNFAGYHAEAGLGGLLQNAGTGGGLHASVGTPWGGHAGAGLGGQLSGEGSNLGGGLYARAGLGHGRPEAAAGLGGRLDGSGRSVNPISGGIYAGATPGGPGTGVFLGGGVRGVETNLIGGPFAEGSNPATDTKEASASTSADAPANGTKSKVHTNIQIIPRSKTGRKRKEVAFVAATNMPADEKTKSQDKEIQHAVVNTVASFAPPTPPLAEDGLVGSLYFGTAPIVKSVDKNMVVASTSAAATPTIQDNASTTATVANNPNTVIARPAHPRWYFRKRFRTAPRKVFYAAAAPTVDSQNSPSNVVGELFASTAGNDGIAYGGTADIAKTSYTSGSLFDDIFNIPISTLSAVNQLLKNNVG